MEGECDRGYNSISSVVAWLDALFTSRKGRTALNAAAFLANQVILTEDNGLVGRFIEVYSDTGADMQKPKISSTSMTVLSVLLAVYLVLLLAITIWGSVRVGWADSLDAHAMSRITASLTDAVNSSRPAADSDTDILDTLPGFIGDAEPDAPVGRLAVGAMAPLRHRREYLAPSDLGL
jgi:hypothetical protein